MLRPSTLLEIFLIFHTIAVRQIELYIIIFDYFDDIARFDFQRYSIHPSHRN